MKMSNDTKRQLLVLSLPFYALATAALLWLSGNEFYEEYFFAHNSVEVEAKIITRAKTVTGKTRMYSIVYSYRDNHGASYQYQSSVNSRTWYDYASTDQIPIKYLPATPSDSRINLPIEDQDRTFAAVFTAFLGIASAGCGPSSYWCYLKKFSKISP